MCVCERERGARREGVFGARETRGKGLVVGFRYTRPLSRTRRDATQAERGPEAAARDATRRLETRTLEQTEDAFCAAFTALNAAMERVRRRRRDDDE